MTIDGLIPHAPYDLYLFGNNSHGGAYCTSCYTGVYPVKFPGQEEEQRPLAFQPARQMRE